MFHHVPVTLTCPTCSCFYAAGNVFCPDDGSRLVAGAAPPPAPLPSAPTPSAPSASPVLPILVGVLLVAVVGLVGVLLWQRHEQVTGRVAFEAPGPAAVVPIASPPPPAPVHAQEPYTQTAYANSPRDGYLVLRQGPRVARHTEVLRIPHGAAIELAECLPQTTSPGGRRGAWCRARYGSAEGWVFDAFLIR